MNLLSNNSEKLYIHSVIYVYVHNDAYDSENTHCPYFTGRYIDREREK